MLSLRVTSEVQPRAKKGHPHHSTTGVASTAWIHPDHVVPSQRRASSEGTISLIAIAKTGKVRAPAATSRRRMSASSGFGPPPSSAVRGSSAMPQIGQPCGASRTTSGCIGQTYSARAGAGVHGSRAMPHSGQSPGTALRTSGWHGQV